MEISRRKLLKAVPAVGIGLAGCTGTEDDSNDSNNNVAGGGNSQQTTERPDSDNDGVPDARDEYPNDPNRSRQIFSESDTRKIEEDEWYYYTIEFSQAGTLEYDFIVRDGPEIDVILIDESEYEYFKEGERMQYYSGVSAMDTAGDDVQGRLEAGSYRLIFDNSGMGEASPPTNLSNDIADVEFNIEASQ